MRLRRLVLLLRGQRLKPAVGAHLQQRVRFVLNGVLGAACRHLPGVLRRCVLLPHWMPFPRLPVHRPAAWMRLRLLATLSSWRLGRGQAAWPSAGAKGEEGGGGGGGGGGGERQGSAL